MSPQGEPQRERNMPTRFPRERMIAGSDAFALGDAHISMAVPSRPLAGRVDRMSEANAGGVGGLILLRASKGPPTRLASLATLPANGREGKRHTLFIGQITSATAPCGG